MQKIIQCPICKNKFEIAEAISKEAEENIKAIAREEIIKEYQAKESVEILDLKEQLEEKKKKENELIEQELDLRKKNRELEQEKKDFVIESERKLDEERKKILEDAVRKAEEEQHSKLLEKDKQLGDALREVEEMKRKLQQGSMQTQGEAFELEFESLLKKEFPNDIIKEVAKGIKGGDIIQEVVDRNGVTVGKVLWELKNTKTWSEGWIDKLKNDQRSINAEDAVLITQAMPNDSKSSGSYRSGIWVVQRAAVIAIASSLRAKLIQLYYAKLSLDGKNDKKEIMYTYLSGTEFKHRVEAIIEAWTAMQDDIEKEKRYFASKWARDDKNIRQVIDNTIGMRGDLEGIMGKVLPAIKGLDLLPSNISDEEIN